jgi:hypothetical protein
VFQNIT